MSQVESRRFFWNSSYKSKLVDLDSVVPALSLQDSNSSWTLCTKLGLDELLVCQLQAVRDETDFLGFIVRNLTVSFSDSE
jgi:hypothetical protein